MNKKMLINRLEVIRDAQTSEELFFELDQLIAEIERSEIFN